MSAHRRTHRAGRALGLALAFLLGVFLVVRAGVVLATDDPAHPETYRQDWGGPHYLGVILVHTAPGLIAVALAITWLVRHRSRRHRTQE